MISVLFELIVPFSSKATPLTLTRASDVEEGATKESLQNTKCMSESPTRNACQDHDHVVYFLLTDLKQPGIPKLMKKSKSTARSKYSISIAMDYSFAHGQLPCRLQLAAVWPAAAHEGARWHGHIFTLWV